jgi:hypothetical protein
MYNFFTKKWVWIHFGRFFSQTHLVTLIVADQQIRTYELLTYSLQVQAGPRKALYRYVFLLPLKKNEISGEKNAKNETY